MANNNQPGDFVKLANALRTWHPPPAPDFNPGVKTLLTCVEGGVRIELRRNMDVGASRWEVRYGPSIFSDFATWPGNTGHRGMYGGNWRALLRAVQREIAP